MAVHEPMDEHETFWRTAVGDAFCTPAANDTGSGEPHAPEVEVTVYGWVLPLTFLYCPTTVQSPVDVQWIALGK